MKRLIGILGILVILVMVGACALEAQANKDVSVIVPAADFARTKNIVKDVEVDQGAVLRLILGSNPSTGFSWTEAAQVSDQAVLNQTGHGYVAPGQTSEPIVGAAGHERWEFKALKAGTAKITVQYARPWEAGVAPEWTFELTVVVK